MFHGSGDFTSFNKVKRGSLKLAKKKQRMTTLNLLVQQVLGKIVNQRKVKDALTSYGMMIGGSYPSSYVDSVVSFSGRYSRRDDVLQHARSSHQTR